MALDTWQALVGLAALLIAYGAIYSIFDVSPATALAYTLLGLGSALAGWKLANRVGPG